MGETIKRITAFFSRDVRTFIPGHPKRTQFKLLSSTLLLEGQDYEYAADVVLRERSLGQEVSSDSFLPFVLDARVIGKRQVRRELLDWRDESIVNLQQVGNDAMADFSVVIARLLSETSVFARVIAKPANEVVANEFDVQVRASIQRQVKESERRLNEILRLIKGGANSAVHLIDECPDVSLEKLSNVKFRSSNRDEIVRILSGFVLGERGIIDRINVQITALVKEQLEIIRRADPDSI